MGIKEAVGGLIIALHEKAMLIAYVDTSITKNEPKATAFIDRDVITVGGIVVRASIDHGRLLPKCAVDQCVGINTVLGIRRGIEERIIDVDKAVWIEVLDLLMEGKRVTTGCLVHSVEKD